MGLRPLLALTTGLLARRRAADRLRRLLARVARCGPASPAATSEGCRRSWPCGQRRSGAGAIREGRRLAREAAAFRAQRRRRAIGSRFRTKRYAPVFEHRLRSRCPHGHGLRQVATPIELLAQRAAAAGELGLTEPQSARAMIG